MITKEELIELLIFEGIIRSTKSLLLAYDHGYTIGNKLERARLLTQGPIEVANEVVMHDLVRDMCLNTVGGRFLVKCRSKFPPDESKYTEDVEKVFLTGSDFEEISSHIAPYCPKIYTLLLSKNLKLTRISYSFFIGLPNLKVLNLSYTSIHRLTNSISNLVSLNALVLRRCLELRFLPCLAPLKALKMLDLLFSGIEEAPEGLGELAHMTYLDLDGTKIGTFPRLILRNLVKLQRFRIGSSEITIDDVKELKNLERFQAKFAKFEEFNEYVSSLLNSKKGPSVFQVRVSCGLMSYGIHRDMKGRAGISLLGERGNKINHNELMFSQDVEIIIPSPELVEFLCTGNLGDNCNFFSELERVASSPLHMLPIRLLYKEQTEESSQSKGLFDAKLLLTLSNLKYLEVWHCMLMEELISTSSSIGVHNSSLEGFLIRECNNLVRLLNPKLLPCFQNLEWIRMDECVSLESISAANPTEKEESDSGICFPKLRHLVLADLPNLRSICDGSCPSIETIHVRRYLMLKRLPLQLPVLDHNSGRPLPSRSSLGLICGEPTWWASLEWDHPHAKTLLRPYFKPCLHCYADDDRYSIARANWPFYSHFRPDLSSSHQMRYLVDQIRHL